MDNLYSVYVKAWRNYEDEKFMSVINTYLRKLLDRYEVKCLNEFHNTFCIEKTEEDTYQIVKYGEIEDETIWEGDNLTGEVIRKIAEEE